MSHSRILQPINIDLNSSILTTDNKGSTLNVTLIPRGDGYAFKISYDLKEFGWVSMSNTIDPYNLSKRKKIRISYNGSGNPNTIELKLIYGNMNGTTFGHFLNRATVTEGLITKEVSYKEPYNQFNCWWPDCQNNDLELTKVIKIELVISNKPGDVPGAGKIIIDTYQIE